MHIPLISNRNPLLVYNSSPFAPNKEIEIQEGDGVEAILGPRGAADSLKICTQYLRQKVSSRTH